MRGDIELKPLIPEEMGNEDELEDETDFGGYRDENLLDNDLDWVSQRGNEETPILGNYFECHYHEALNITFLFNDVLTLEDECSNPKFVRSLMTERDFKLVKTLSDSGLVTNYEFSYYTDPDIEGIRQYKTVRTVDLNQILEKAGVFTAVGLSIIELVSGLSISLTRKGSDIKGEAKQERNWDDLTQAHKKSTITWTELKEASGDALIFTGKHLVVIAACGTVYLYFKKNKRRRSVR